MGVVERDNPDFRTYPLPLARIKKVMKSDEEVKVGPSSSSLTPEFCYSSLPWFSFFHCAGTFGRRVSRSEVHLIGKQERWSYGVVESDCYPLQEHYADDPIDDIGRRSVS